MMDDFLAFSADVTAFTTFELRGTGRADEYLATVKDIVGNDILGELLAAYSAVRALLPVDREQALRRSIFGDEKLGPVARSIVKLWYVGIWYELPRAWTEKFGALPRNVTFTVSADAYIEGLLWTAVGAHPPGAKAPGYASWVGPPDIPELPVLS